MNTCPACQTETAETVCATCRHELRADLAEIQLLHPWLETAALVNGYRGEHEGGLPLGGEPMVMIGPFTLWTETDHDQTPTGILAEWEMGVRVALKHQPPKHFTLPTSAQYLDAMLPNLLAVQDFPWRWFIQRVHRLRTRMEDVLHAGLRDEGGAPCPDCSAAMIRKVDARHGLVDQWECGLCHRTLKAPDYWAHVMHLYRQNAPALSAEELALEVEIPAARIRVWGSKGYVSKRGRDHAGRQLYDAGEVRDRAALASCQDGVTA